MTITNCQWILTFKMLMLNEVNHNLFVNILFQMHITVLKNGENLCISKCTQCCDKYHCPFCETWVYKPRESGSVVNHVQNHLKLAVHQDDFTIVKCNLKCREYAHFHCCYCPATVLRRGQLKTHLTKCKQKFNAEEEFEGTYSFEDSPEHEQCIYLFFSSDTVDSLVHTFSSLLATGNTQNCSIWWIMKLCCGNKHLLRMHPGFFFQNCEVLCKE